MWWARTLSTLGHVMCQHVVPLDVTLKCHCTRLFRTCFVSIWPCQGVFACDVCEDKLRSAIHSRILLSFLELRLGGSGHNT